MTWAWDSASFFNESSNGVGTKGGSVFGPPLPVAGSQAGAFGIPAEVFATSSVTGKVLQQSPSNLGDDKEQHRVIHRVSLDAISHNFRCVETAASGQRCSVFVVVKGDGYGHSAINAALHLADYCGADAFAVATLEEGITLRKAFETTQPGQQLDPEGKAEGVGDATKTAPLKNINKVTNGSGLSDNSSSLFSMFSPSIDNGGTEGIGKALIGSSGGLSPPTDNSTSTATTSASTTASTTNTVATKGCLRRPPHIRIHVLGPPVGYPRCFDDYYHHEIEVMVTGPEVASSLMEWVKDAAERRRRSVEKEAKDTKAKALIMDENQNSLMVSTTDVNKHLPATLSNVSGRDMAKELKRFLMNQQKQEQQQKQGIQQSNAKINGSSAEQSAGAPSSTQTDSEYGRLAPSPGPSNCHLFMGIEAAAKKSRTREIALTFERASNESDLSTVTSASLISNNIKRRKVLRWHALVDTGMGRLGFKTQSIANKEDNEMLDDIVEIIRKLVEVEFSVGSSPIEFYGMCTHMADASKSNSSYTAEQIGRFKSLLRRIRTVGISIPTISTDNSAALLTPEFTHFDPNELLSQPTLGAPTRGFVRTGGAIFGQRPAYKQLRAVSTLLASVRHIAILKKGESVGYDRAYVAPEEVRIATLTIGFADGYPRDLGNGIGKVEIRKQLFPIVGNVCMDMVMVELGKVRENKGTDIVVGDTAALWGPADENSGEGLVRLQDISTVLKTTQSALTCGLDTARVTRQFV